MKPYLALFFWFSLSNALSQDTLTIQRVKNTIVAKSDITEWLKALPDSITNYSYSQVELEIKTDKTTQIGPFDDWEVQVYEIDIKNGYLAANGYLPGVGEYTPEEQFVIFKNESDDYLLAYHFLDEHFNPQSHLRFFRTDGNYLYEINSAQILPELTIWDFVNMESLKKMKKNFPQIEDLLEKMLIVYYLPQKGTSINATVSSENLSHPKPENQEYYKSVGSKLESILGDRWETNNHEFYGKVELHWNRLTNIFEH